MSYAQFVQIPLRLRTRVNLLKNKLFLSPHVGAGLLIKSYGGIEVYPENSFNIDVKTDFPKTTSRIETGISLEYIAKSWKFAFLTTTNYSRRELINYAIEDIDTYFSSSGNYFTYQVRVGYAISNFWNREFWKDKKIRKSHKSNKKLYNSTEEYCTDICSIK